MARAGVNTEDQINIYAVHTPKANEELKKYLSPSTRVGALSSVKYKSFKPSVDMDLALGIYELTKNPESMY